MLLQGKKEVSIHPEVSQCLLFSNLECKFVELFTRPYTPTLQIFLGAFIESTLI